MEVFNPIALRTLWSFGHSECNRVKILEDSVPFPFLCLNGCSFHLFLLSNIQDLKQKVFWLQHFKPAYFVALHHVTVNPLYTGGLFHYYMLGESIWNFRGVGSILSLLIYFWWKILLADSLDPDQMPHFRDWSGSALFAYDPLWVSRKEWVKV